MTLEGKQLVERVKALRVEGRTQVAIAAEVGVSQARVSQILVREGLGGRLIKLRRRSRFRDCDLL